MKIKMRKILGTTIVIVMTTLVGCTDMADNSTYTMQKPTENVQVVEDSYNYEEATKDPVEDESMYTTENLDTSESTENVDVSGDKEEEMDVVEESFESYEAVVNHTANVREGIGVDANRIDILKAGDIVIVLEELEEWSRILLDEREGFIMTQYLSEATEDNIAEVAQQVEEAEKEIAVVTVTNTVSNANDTNVTTMPDVNTTDETSELVVNEDNNADASSTPAVGIQNGANNNTNTYPSGNNNSNVGTTNTPVVTPQYTCEARILNSNPIYSNSRVVVYIKTDHPDGSKLSITSNSGKFTFIVGLYYSDVTYVDKDNFYTQMERVKDGYVCILQPLEVGNYTFTIKDSSSGASVAIGSFDMVVNDRAAAENEFYQNVINSVTTPDMTNVQKMDAICEYVRTNFMYKASDVNGGAIFLTSLEGPWVANHRIHCLESTAIMQEFASRLGLQSECTYAGYWNHHYATVTIDGVPYIYDACPMGETGTVSSWDYVL